jgi:MFS family permease
MPEKKRNTRKPYIKNTAKQALYFVILMGVVSLLADMTYEGARSITGPFLAFLGANATVVGVVSGFGEFIGYALRMVSGFISDRTKRYWTITIIGYVINLGAIPLLALVGRWELAAILLVMERMGKAIRVPARDAMLSHATKRIGTGWGFGLHEALDQIGAVSGPLIIALVLFLQGKNGYPAAFLVLGVPAVLAILLVIISSFLYPNPGDFEAKKISLAAKGLNRNYWIYLVAASCLALGYADFPLLAFHVKKQMIASDSLIPVFHAMAMGIDAIAALIFGKLFDRKGIAVMAWAVLCSLFFAPLVFFGKFPQVVIGVLLWGIGMGAQESIMRAGIAELTSSERRASAYGIFSMFFGLFWFLGSATMGVLYDISIPYLVAFSMLFQLLALPFFLAIRKTD